MSLIGNKRDFAFELIPVSPSWETRYGPEAAAWVGLAIWVGGKNLCRNVITGSSEIDEYLYVPGAPLADWIVRSFPALQFEERAADFPTSRLLHESVSRWGNSAPPASLSEDEWIQEREAWWSRHFLRAGAEGAWLPNLAMVRDDEQLILSWAPPRFAGREAPELLESLGLSALPWILGSVVLRDFVSTIAASLRSANLSAVYPWIASTDPLNRPHVGGEQHLELYTGRNIAELNDVLGSSHVEAMVRSLDHNGHDPAAIAEFQVLRDLSPHVSTAVGDVLTAIGEQVRAENAEAYRALAATRQLALDAARSASTLEDAGYLAATELRREMGLDGRPIGNVGQLFSRLGMSYEHSETEGGHERMMVAFIEGGASIAKTLTTPRTTKRWGRRFESCRALGHTLLDPIRAHTLGAAAGPFAQDSRRRRSGAFAAEFLLPEVALERSSDGRLDGAAGDIAFSRLLEEFGVGATTAAHQLWNRGWLSSIEVRDDLIDRFASSSD